MKNDEKKSDLEKKILNEILLNCRANLDDIGKKVGLNKASIYHYFKSKEDIFITLVLNEFKQFTTELQKKIQEDMNCVEKVIEYFPNLFVAGLIFVVAAFLADFSQKLVVDTLEKEQITYSRFLGRSARWIIWFFSILAILYQLRISPPLILAIFIGSVLGFLKYFKY